MNKPTIIAIASGKGGVGKSLVTANLAIALAQSGKNIIAIDMDLGGSNLHSYFGLSNTHPGLGDYLISKQGRLEDYLLTTDIPNLQFIPGDGRTPCMANLKFSEKIRLLLGVRWLKADYILLDLSGGSTHNTLDFFALSRQGLIISTLEYPSIMNVIVYLRNLIFRTFDRELKNYPEVLEMLKKFRQNSMDSQINTAKIIEQITKHNSDAGQKARKVCQQLKPKLIYNNCFFPEQLSICHKIDKSSDSLLSMQINHFGSLFEDHCVKEAVYKNIPLLTNFPDSIFAHGIRNIAEKIINHWESTTQNSAEMILNETEQFYQQHQTKKEP